MGRTVIMNRSPSSVPAVSYTHLDVYKRQGPGYALFAAIKKKLGSPRIIAEDLGFLTEDVTALLKQCGYQMCIRDRCYAAPWSAV